MKRLRLHLQSLKARVTLLTLLIVVLSLVTLGAYTRWLFGQEVLRFAGEQQQSALSLLSGQVTQGVKDRLAALNNLAVQVPPQTLHDKTALGNFLQEKHLLAGLFNGGLLVWSRQGVLLADVPFSPAIDLAQALDPADLATVLREDRPLHAIVRKQAQGTADVLFMVVPMHGPAGAVTGALAGVIRLDEANFLSQLTALPYGKTGNFFVVDTRQRLIFATSDRSRLMEVLPAPGISTWIDRFMQGFEGTARVLNPHGVEVQVSIQQIPLAGWYASVTLSPDEAFALISAVAPRARLAGLALSLLCIAFIWLMLQHQMAPLSLAANTLKGFVRQAQPPQALQVVRQDEIGQLVGGFNQLLETLGQQQQVLQKSELFKQAVLNSVTAGIAVLDREGLILTVNDAWLRSGSLAQPGTEQTPVTAQVGSNYLALCDTEVADLATSDALSVSGGIRGVLSGRLPHFYLEYASHTAQQQRWRSISVTPLERDTLQGAVVCIENISERVQMQNQVRELAFYDPLTGLPNRRLVLDRLSQQMLRARREQSHLALLFVDLDHFKPVNDALGHAAGDWLLQAVAQRIQSCLRESDTPARIGGDEFVVVLPDLHEAQAAMAVAEKIRLELERVFIHPQGSLLHISSSIGVAIYPDHAQTEKDLLRLGDEAMYQAKKEGRNAVVLCGSVAVGRTGEFAGGAPHSFVHLRWKPAFDCGHALIDREHQKLFELTNVVLDQTATREAWPAAFEQSFQTLMAHTRQHFAHEEELLQSIGFADLAAHAAKHQALLARADALHQFLHDSDSDQSAEIELIKFLVSELAAGHLLRADRDFFALLNPATAPAS